MVRCAGDRGAESVSGDETAGWRGKDRAAKALRWSIMAAPVVVALTLSLVLNHVLPAPSSWSWAIARVAGIAIVSMVSIAIVERAGRRLLPLVHVVAAVAGVPRSAHRRGSSWR